MAACWLVVGWWCSGTLTHVLRRGAVQGWVPPSAHLAADACAVVVVVVRADCSMGFDNKACHYIE
jgi:hypothetical protein